jgi:ribosomal protein L11 methyltransferase
MPGCPKRHPVNTTPCWPATPLKVLAPLLCAHVEKGGHLVLAGILDRQAEELNEAYAPYCQLTVHDTQEGWILMTAGF